MSCLGLFILPVLYISILNVAIDLSSSSLILSLAILKNWSYPLFLLVCLEPEDVAGSRYWVGLVSSRFCVWVQKDENYNLKNFSSICICFFLVFFFLGFCSIPHLFLYLSVFSVEQAALWIWIWIVLSNIIGLDIWMYTQVTGGSSLGL